LAGNSVRDFFMHSHLLDTSEG